MQRAWAAEHSCFFPAVLIATPEEGVRGYIAKLDHHLGFAIALENVQLLSVSLRKIPTKAL